MRTAVSVAVIVTCMARASAAAQQPTSANQDSVSDNGIALEAVTVTARRIKENLQTVPLAITALTAAQIKADQITGPQDLNRTVPSLTVSQPGTTRNSA
jgi:iron complex outermembrane receptor protein